DRLPAQRFDVAGHARRRRQAARRARRRLDPPNRAGQRHRLVRATAVLLSRRMDLAFSGDDDAFREEVRTWLEENAPKERRPRGGVAMREYDLAWQRRQWEAGWAGIAWPVEYGGRGLPLTQQLVWYEEYARTGLKPIDT